MFISFFSDDKKAINQIMVYKKKINQKKDRNNKKSGDIILHRKNNIKKYKDIIIKELEKKNYIN